ncbi:MAG: helix-turn-helix domain-containing protein, partial [Psychrobacter sp.]
MTTPSSNNQSNAQGSFGAMLQQARKTKKISLEEAAAELFILKRHLQALENENFSEMPQVAFARGFAINYAKFLDLDPVRVA